MLLGGNPYSTDNIDEHFVDKLKRGYRLDKPTYAIDIVYASSASFFLFHYFYYFWQIKPTKYSTQQSLLIQTSVHRMLLLLKFLWEKYCMNYW